MEDVDKLDKIAASGWRIHCGVEATELSTNKQCQDGFIHYHLIRFCQATRLQYLIGHVQHANQNVLQQHVDHHIASALLKKGTQDAYKT